VAREDAREIRSAAPKREAQLSDGKMDADIEKRFTATRSENDGEIIEGI
jgi:hypothetical protein